LVFVPGSQQSCYTVLFIRLAHVQAESLPFQSPCLLSVVFLPVPRQISKTKPVRHDILSPSKDMMSVFALEVAKYPKSSHKPQSSVRAYCLALLTMQLVF